MVPIPVPTVVPTDKPTARPSRFPISAPTWQPAPAPVNLPTTELAPAADTTSVAVALDLVVERTPSDEDKDALKGTMATQLGLDQSALRNFRVTATVRKNLSAT
jgi:hypothetical protein